MSIAIAYNWKNPAEVIRAEKNRITGVLDVARGMGTPLGVLRWVIHASDYNPKNKQYIQDALYATSSNWNAQYWDWRNEIDSNDNDGREHSSRDLIPLLVSN